MDDEPSSSRGSTLDRKARAAFLDAARRLGTALSEESPEARRRACAEAMKRAPTNRAARELFEAHRLRFESALDQIEESVVAVNAMKSRS